MTEYLVEVYAPRNGAAGVRDAAARARASADAVSRKGVPVRYVRAIFVPDDETCFHVFEAGSREAVRAASERAAFHSVRIVEASRVEFRLEGGGK
jgi:hypothetical protein